MECLTDIVGVTTSTCDCIINGLTTEEVDALRPSTSGLFMDDLEGGIHLKAVKNADTCRNLAQMCISARDQAIKMLQDDLIVALSTKYKRANKPYKGGIGRMSFAQTLGVTRPIQGWRLTPNYFSDGMVKVKALSLIVNKDTTEVLQVILTRVPVGEVVGEVVNFWPVNTTANMYATIDIGADPLKLPFVVNNQRVEYYFTFDRSAAFEDVAPKDNIIRCSTCEKNADPFNGYVTVKGVQLNSLGNLSDIVTDETYCHGIIADVEINCDTETLFCREYNDEEPVAIAMSYAVRFKAGELLIEDVLRQTDINRYTTMDKERLWGKRSHYRKEYEGRILFLANHLDIVSSNCYVCQEVANKPRFQPIYS